MVSYLNIAIAVLALCSSYGSAQWTNNAYSTKGEHLIVLAPPAYNDYYYAQQYGVADDIIDFQVNYAKKIIGKDNVVIVGDRRTLAQFRRKGIPEDVLLELYYPMEDIWMRDFTTVNPYNPVQFRYTAAAQEGSQSDANYVQRFFKYTFGKMGVRFNSRAWAPYIDGGNVVDNYVDKIVVTDKFLRDNRLSKQQAIKLLKNYYRTGRQVSVAVLPTDPEDPLGHADGMVMFLSQNSIAVTNYDVDPQFQQRIHNELYRAFGRNINIVKMPDLGYSPPLNQHIASSCGIIVNGVLTTNYLYVPVFGAGNQDAINTIQQNSNRVVVPVNADGVCGMGGSVRCLSWQVVGSNARRIILYARKRNFVFPNY